MGGNRSLTGGVRWMVHDDIGKSRRIDGCWTDEQFAILLADSDFCLKVFETGDHDVVGFIAYGKSQRTREVTVHRIGVHPSFRRHGVGSALLASIQSAGRRLVATVPETSKDLIGLLRSQGWLATRVERGWFGERDGIRLERDGKADSAVIDAAPSPAF